MKHDHVICWGCARMTWQKIKHHWQSHQLTTLTTYGHHHHSDHHHSVTLKPPQCVDALVAPPASPEESRGILQKQVCSLFIFLCIPFTNYVYRYKKHWSMSIPPSRNIKKAQTMVYTVVWALGKFFLINFLFHKLSSQQRRRQGGMECEGTKE